MLILFSLYQVLGMLKINIAEYLLVLVRDLISKGVVLVFLNPGYMVKSVPTITEIEKAKCYL